MKVLFQVFNTEVTYHRLSKTNNFSRAILQLTTDKNFISHIIMYDIYLTGMMIILELFMNIYFIHKKLLARTA